MFELEINKPALPAGFVRLSAYAPTIICDMKYYSGDNFLSTQVDGYVANEAIMTETCAQALAQLQDYLVPLGFGLKIFDAYRPHQAVQHFLRWANEPECSQIAQRFHPTLTKAAIFEQGFIASPSSHTRGSTVDLTLVSQQRELDMGTEFDFFGATSAFDYTQVSAQQHANRLLLRQLMQAFGFIGFDLEWWHFTLKNEPYPNQYFDFPVT